MLRIEESIMANQLLPPELSNRAQAEQLAAELCACPIERPDADQQAMITAIVMQSVVEPRTREQLRQDQVTNIIIPPRSVAVILRHDPQVYL